jgi:acyl-coenzyme A synthetase/AMP-(fatty) acid ligase
MQMFLDIDHKKTNSLAAIDDSGESISYGELSDFSVEFSTVLKKRTLIFILTENSIGSLAGYVASLSGRIVPLLLSSNIDRGMLDKLVTVYHPEFMWIPSRLDSAFNYKAIFRRYDYVLLKTEYIPFDLYPELSLLLATSGSTGSPKLVRHSYMNVQENAKNVAEIFNSGCTDRPVAMLPMNYTMGLSVITSHLFAGSTILLTKKSFTDREFWNFIKEQKATSFTGVPYSFEVLNKLRFFNMDLPDLHILSQGGGKLGEELFRKYAEYALRTGKKFIATYGQTEGTARMAYLQPEMAINKIGSIGKAIPGGLLSLIDENGNEISETEATGEMVYKGCNVTLGYAYQGKDLNRGDENNGVLRTGDIARRDSEGYYYIVGRISRFLKLYGIRIGLDESEQMIKAAFDTDCICTGNDEKMIVLLTDKNKKEAIYNYLIEKTGLFHSAVEAVVVDEIPRNENGKSIY